MLADSIRGDFNRVHPRLFSFLAVITFCLLSSCGRDDSDEQKPQQPPRPSNRPHEQSPHLRPARTLLKSPGGESGNSIAQHLIQRDRATPHAETDEPSQLISQYAEASTEKQLEIVAALGASGAPEVWDFLCQAAASPNQDLRLAALDALAIHQGGDPSKAIAACLNFPDEETRALAATLLGRRVRDPEVWGRVATDPSPSVRVAYLAAVEDAPARIRLASAQRALTSADPQLRMEAASVLGGVRSKEAVELLIPLLDDPATTDVASDGLFYFFGRGFSSAREARSWWAGEQASYSQNLEQETD